MPLYILNISAVREETGDSFSFNYMCKADSEESAKRDCESHLPGCKVTYHSSDTRYNKQFGQNINSTL